MGSQLSQMENEANKPYVIGLLKDLIILQKDGSELKWKETYIQIQNVPLKSCVNQDNLLNFVPQFLHLYVLFYLLLFFKDCIYLFMRDTHTHTHTQRQRHRQREKKQAPCREPDVRLDLRLSLIHI